MIQLTVLIYDRIRLLYQGKYTLIITSPKSERHTTYQDKKRILFAQIRTIFVLACKCIKLE